jgi:hypothetical protein
MHITMPESAEDTVVITCGYETAGACNYLVMVCPVPSGRQRLADIHFFLVWPVSRVAIRVPCGPLMSLVRITAFAYASCIVEQTQLCMTDDHGGVNGPA